SPARGRPSIRGPCLVRTKGWYYPMRIMASSTGSAGLLRALVAASCLLPVMGACGGRSDTQDYLYDSDGTISVGASSSSAGRGSTAGGTRSSGGSKGTGASGTITGGSGPIGSGATGTGGSGP